MRRIFCVFFAFALLACDPIDRNTPKGGIPSADWALIADALNTRPAAAYVNTHVHWQYHLNMLTGAPVHPVWAWIDQTHGDVLHIDTDCARYPCWQNVIDRTWWLYHEIGHTFPGVEGSEHNAQCAAKAMMGREVQGFTFREPYWSCPPAELAAWRVRLTQLGVAL